MPDAIREALSYVPADERETWVLMGMAIRDELGEEGFAIWDAWSAQSDRYKPADARSVWRSFRGRGVTIATLYKLAKEHGWEGQGEAPWRERPRVVQPDQDEAKRHARAREKAQAMISAAGMSRHPYLISKGFPDAEGLVLDHLLLVPMRDMKTGQLNSVQTITFDGHKKFLAGGKAKGSLFVLGAGPETYLCEGYATGLSIRAALQSLYRQARVVVCFSAANVAHVARSKGNYVVADHDLHGVGEKYAVKSQLPFWMPPEPGDANDFDQLQGRRALAEALNGLRKVRRAQ